MTKTEEQLRLSKDLVGMLRSFAKYHSIAGDHRSIAYRKAAATIENLDDDISLYRDIDQLTTLPTIGLGIAEKIKEYVDKGKSESLEDLKRRIVKDSFKVELYDIEGFGPSTIEELFKRFKIRNMEELENILKSKVVRDVPGFGRKKAMRLLANIEEHKSGETRRNTQKVVCTISRSD